MVLGVAAVSCGGQTDFSIDPSTDPYLVEDELLIAELRDDFSPSLFLAAFPLPPGSTAETIPPDMLLRNAFVNEMATALIEERFVEVDEYRSDEAARLAPAMARYDTRIGYAAAVDLEALLWGNLDRVTTGQVFGNGFVLLAGLQAGVLDLHGASMEILPMSAGGARGVFTNAEGDQSMIDFSSFDVLSPTWGRKLEEMMMVGPNLTVEIDGREYRTRTFAGLLSRRTIEFPYNEALDEFLQVVGPFLVSS